MPTTIEQRKARVAYETHPLQKIVDPWGRHIGTGCPRCGLLLPAGTWLAFLAPCDPGTWLAADR